MSEKISLYSLYDNQGLRYDTPFFAHNDLFAERRFTIQMDENQSLFKRYKDDFVLMKLGEFNVLTGKFTEDIKKIVEGRNIKMVEGD